MNYSDWQEIFSEEWQGLWARLGETAQTRERYFGRRVSFCVILNAKSGACSEDCAFCSQSGRVKGEAPHYPLLAREKLVAAAKAAAAAGASRFSIVTAGRGLITPREQEAVIEAVAPSARRRRSRRALRHRGARTSPVPEGRRPLSRPSQPGDRGIRFSEPQYAHLRGASSHHRGCEGRGAEVRAGASWGWAKAVAQRWEAARGPGRVW